MNNIKTTLNNIELTLTFKGSKQSNWGTSKEQHHRLKVTYNGQSVFFDFWTSKARPKAESEDDILSAFNCVVHDALCGANSFEYFCWELGYNEDSRKDEKIYLACVKTFKKLEKIGLNEDVLTDLMNEVLNEY